MVELLQIIIIIAEFFLLGFSRKHLDFGNANYSEEFVVKERIVGGHNADEGEVPWMAKIFIYDRFICGGSIIAEKWIISAAHCFLISSVPYIYFVRIGSRYIDSGNLVHMNLKKICIHPNFGDPYIFSNDIALLKVNNSIYYNDFIRFIYLNKQLIELNDEMATVAGWGTVNERYSIYPRVLQVVDLPIIDNRMCEDWFNYRGMDLKIEDSQLCAGFKDGGKDSCQGDSGGPLYLKENNNSGILIGIVSNGLGCARPYAPGIYTRISSYILWIERIIK
ncbi:anionic trypsin-like isoform X2 [Centruroides sculpturatus]|uniref:anionic trypsin-like isoform X2 n=1 Tax=Centruroides sculpturatus TaxID=218467 RepID=UPI000C6D8252|nr:anionic trypsin-like isoform X2 [Centruroides sculpturatus]